MIDTDKIDQAILALLYSGRHDHSPIGDSIRAWKTFDWEAMSRLYDKGMISDPQSKNKSVVFTEDGIKESKRLFHELFESTVTETKFIMAGKVSLNAKALEALGAQALAALVAEISAGDAALKRRLRMALATKEGSGALAGQVRKRLQTLKLSKSYIDCQKSKAFISEIDQLRHVISEDIGAESPVEAVKLFWGFIAIAASCYERYDDSHGRLGDIFCQSRGPYALTGAL